MDTGRPDERGAVTLWVLGLCVCVLFLGGLGLDLWRAVAVRRELAAMADAGATAGASGLDEEALREGGLVLDPERARRLASAALTAHSGWDEVDEATIEVADDTRVVVTLAEEVEFTLLRVFLPDDPFTVEVTARAEPRRVP